MLKGKRLIISGIVVAGLLIVVTAGIVLGQSDTGYRFTMELDSPGRDAVTFDGTALGPDVRLEGQVGGIASAMLQSRGDLFILTPAIMTAREVENPDPPVADEAGWSDWLIEPARVNPINFAALLGEDPAVDGQVQFGSGRSCQAGFEEGKLVQLRFPSPSGEGNITYTYSDIEADEDLSADEFRVPSDYLVSD